MFAFVLMPFDAAFDDIYKLGIKETAEKLGIRAERVDEQIFHKENILERIYSQIDAADFIIADLTDRNPNVFYETGYAHAKGKLCLLLTSKADDNVPNERSSIAVAVDVAKKTVTINGVTWSIPDASRETIVAMDDKGSLSLNRITGAVNVHFIELNGLKKFYGECKPAQKLF
jgi:nucleoside 2-deoxyribosyltransferase